MKFKLKENVEKYPGNNGNAYSSTKYLYNLINIDKNKIIDSNVYTENINESIDWEVPKDKHGGMIIFSTDVNAIELSSNKVINKIKQISNTLSNRINATKKIDKIAQDNNLVGWTVGKFLSGRYTSKKGTPYGENSISVELIGIDKPTLIKVAEELCNDFNQEEVLVKNYIDGNIYFVSDE